MSMRIVERFEGDIRVECGFRDETPNPDVYDGYRIWRGEAGFYWDDEERSFPTLTECAADIEATLRREAAERAETFIPNRTEIKRLPRYVGDGGRVEGVRVYRSSPDRVTLQIRGAVNLATTSLTGEQVDALIRALAAARVELWGAQ